jgi:hypothetical protein
MLRALWIAAGLSVALGSTMALRAAVAARTAGARLEMKVAWLRQLRDMERTASRCQEATDAFQGLATTRPPPLPALLKRHFPGAATADVRETERIEAASGWTLRRNEVSLTDTPLDRVMAFLVDAESQRPPWRLVKCDIMAVPQVPGSGRVVLRLEALEK